MLSKRMLLATALVALGAGLAPFHASADAYPDRPIRLIVPYAAGGGTDAIARVIAQGMTEQLGQQLVVDNNGTAGGNVATAQAAKAEPDGYTLLMSNQGPMTVNPHLFKNVKVDPLTAFDPVTLIAEAPLVVVVPEGSRFTSFQALVEAAKAAPGGLTYGSAGNGSASHLATLLLANSAGLDMVHVPYKGTAPALADLASGNIQMLIDAPIGVMAQVRAGKIRALAMLSKNRVPGVEEVPTIVESGGPLIESSTWVMFLAPAGTPKEIVDKVSAEVSKALKDEALRRRLAEQAVIPVGATPEDTGKFLQSEIDKWEKVITTAGVKPDA